ncbi:MAG: hypothetical protein HRJ53_07490 [Acidobacteria bacterium Pan2503]|uniref:Uncharacterized protein n=1 Tax=Candidatus Acidiferrum panamense TaxID=2741543 RepID=A0A7V8NNZ7_9BACT|nr:hypothetical protein [Candidatus Acidoferrum panamensis]
MSDANANAAAMPTPDQVLVPASDAVTLDGISKPLLEYVVRLGYLHWLLFGEPLRIQRVYEPIALVTNAQHVGTHVAFELESLEEHEQLVFLGLVVYSAPANQCVMADMRALPPGKRITVDYYGE